ncbi:hypothetical protein [Polaromonas glacialis]|uniref:hypothetical protein n=1 Tax=Polaromonas glacialis TaxID=866564 RepID=UPI0012EC29CE|nr:hypothetical protein [Polaromonas glacialis]
MKDFDKAADRQAYEDQRFSPEFKKRIHEKSEADKLELERSDQEWERKYPDIKKQELDKALLEHCKLKVQPPPGAVRESLKDVEMRVEKQIIEQRKINRQLEIDDRNAGTDRMYEAERMKHPEMQQERDSVEKMRQEKLRDREVTRNADPGRTPEIKRDPGRER